MRIFWTYGRLLKGAILGLGLLCLASAIVTAEEAPTVLILEAQDTSQSPLSRALYMDVISRISAQVEKAGFRALRKAENIPADADQSESEENSNLLDEIQKGDIPGQEGHDIAFAAVVRLFADLILLNEGTEIRLGIKGRLLDVASGDILARFDLKLPDGYQAPPNCDRRCLIQLLQSNASGIADSLGKILGERLNARQESLNQ